MEFPNARTLSVALHLVAEAQRLLEQAELKMPTRLMPALLREMADRIEKQTYVKPETNNETHSHPEK